MLSRFTFEKFMSDEDIKSMKIEWVKLGGNSYMYFHDFFFENIKVVPNFKNNK